MAATEYDAIIIGGGPGGLSAAVISRLRGMNVLVLESGAFGGPLVSLYPEKLVLNYPGFPDGVLAKEIGQRLVAQAGNLGVEMRSARVLKITVDREVETEEETYRGKAIIIATGSSPRSVGVLGEAEFNTGDRGVYYFVTDPEVFRDKRVVIAGGGDTAVDSALTLEGVAESLTVIHRRDKFRAYEVNAAKVLKSDKIDVRFESEIVEIKGTDAVESVFLKGKEGKTDEIDADAVILAFGLVPNNEIFADLGLELDYEGRIITDSKQKTNLDGIYAAGDIVAGTGHLELIVVAVAQGAVAAHHAYIETAEPYWG
ncbi:thioredoxin reductase [archaeon BMS3Abin16]|nr:thioredoxin reductase [archaeon BMS3Abin16]